jgi:hypothetical protein
LLYDRVGLDGYLSVYASLKAGITGTGSQAQIFLVEMGSQELFAWAGLEAQSS